MSSDRSVHMQQQKLKQESQQSKSSSDVDTDATLANEHHSFPSTESDTTYNRQYYQNLIQVVDIELKSILSSSGSVLQEAREIVSKANLSIDSDLHNINIITTTTTTQEQPSSSSLSPKGNSGTLHNSSSTIPISTTTGGHSNTDHIILRTGFDDRTDRINEYKRQYIIRERTLTQLEQKLYDQKWDKPNRVIGERRRRIVREIDSPDAPPEPPPSGYVIFLGQMTTKLRYDRYIKNKKNNSNKNNNHMKHDQTKMVQEISKMWKVTLTDQDREYYHVFVMNLKKEYHKQLIEYRATGYYTPSSKYVRNNNGIGLWTHIQKQDKNALELEIDTYETVQFPSTHLNEDEQQQRIQSSREKRKAKIKLQRKEHLQNKNNK
jgi:hypothetical protein